MRPTRNPAPMLTDQEGDPFGVSFSAVTPGVAVARATAILLLGTLLQTHAAEPVTALEFAPDGRHLAVGLPRRIELIPTDGTSPMRSASLDLPKVTAIRHESSGLAAWVSGGIPGESGAVIRLALPALTPPFRLDFPDDVAQAIALHPGGSQLAVAIGNDVQVHASAPRSGTAPMTLKGHSARVLATAYSPDGTLLVSVAADRAVKVWNPRDGTLVRSFGHHTEAPHAIVFRPGAAVATAASAGDDRTVRVWQPGIGRMVRIVRAHDGPILALGYSPDGRTLYTAGSEGVVRRIDADSDTVLGMWNASTDWVHALAVHPTTGAVATGAADGAVTVAAPDGSSPRRLRPDR